MTYAGDRILYDADTHIMELPDFLRKYADPDIREELPLVDYGRSLVTHEADCFRNSQFAYAVLSFEED